MNLPSIQEMFDIIYRHFVINKNPPSYDKETQRCMYRSPNGGKCAVGLFIPDNEYKPEMDSDFWGINVRRLNVRFKLLISDANEDFLKKMQDIHDFKSNDTQDVFYQYVKDQMEEYARDHGLTIPTS
jgi:hypothetical protein